ncbi:hypothetical protein BKA82DRAFT_26032 [Pisolithus tinctorius]|nr:hypothetical protein BKA82DRAFT_26032 [Pisolithus tinctorius]
MENRSGILGCQARLSEQLQLLNHYIKPATRILDTIAVALTTGNPGEMFAAAFDIREGLRLFLTKRCDIFPFLFPRYAEDIVKREEFPHSTDDRDSKYDAKQVSSVQTHHDLLTEITKIVQDFNLQNLSATPDLYAVYSQLAVTDLNSSRPLCPLCNAKNSVHGTGETALDLDDDYLEAMSRALKGNGVSEDTSATSNNTPLDVANGFVYTALCGSGRTIKNSA